MTDLALRRSFSPLRLESRSFAWRAGAVIVGSLLLALSSQIKVPMYPVPMTMQTFAVTLIGALYGWRLGAVTVIAWLFEGLIGLPVLAGAAVKQIITAAAKEEVIPAIAQQQIIARAPGQAVRAGGALEAQILRHGAISLAALYEPPFTGLDASGLDGVFAGAAADDVAALVAPFAPALQHSSQSPKDTLQ